MRDFRDAKAMAHTLRTALSAQGLKITNSQSLELIAEAFGADDWNTLAAMIRREAVVAHRNTASQPLSGAGNSPVLPFSARFAAAMHQALTYANQRKHEYATLEHLLLAFTEDADASAMMKACNVDLVVLKGRLINYLDNGLGRLVLDNGGDARPTPAFHVVQRAGLQAKPLSHPMVTGADALVSIFEETLSPAARLLDEQGMTRQDAAKHLGGGGKNTAL